jgi:mRNA-degrading endonuclease RelE of RelBE toxin-antitoxin system
MRVQFAEIAEASLRRLLRDDQLPTARTHLAFYLRRDHELTSLRLQQFEEVDVHLYRFGGYRVVYEVRTDLTIVWSFTRAVDGNE